MDKHVITTEAVLKRGSFYRKMWVVGWLFSAICLGAVGYVVGLDKGRRESIAEIELLSRRLDATVALQEHTTATFVKAWEDQRRNFEMVQTWGEYISERQNAVDFNQGRITKRGSKIDPRP